MSYKTGTRVYIGDPESRTMRYYSSIPADSSQQESTAPGFFMSIVYFLLDTANITCSILRERFLSFHLPVTEGNVQGCYIYRNVPTYPHILLASRRAITECLHFAPQ